ncbi:G-protein coupled receptor 171 [Collichthys lucidus]|uniref:G-protein coupled receptor 171 n=1 Tax=Collichthys lucidus TaxID=240159 RepID=A0A4U5V0G7_COLLU|nr:G-protein coupled receptor 171 [Collichthys lucidus]
MTGSEQVLFVFQLLMMPPSTDSSAGAAEMGKECIVNDQMAPFIVIYILIFIISLPGNLLSVWAFIRSPRTNFKVFMVFQQQSTSVYLVNLLVADLLLLLALPFKILKDLGVMPWNLMVFHCQASAVTIYISLYASIAFLTFIITDRYLQDCHSLNSLRLREVGFARLLSLVVWLMLLLIMVPNMALPTNKVQRSGSQKTPAESQGSQTLGERQAAAVVLAYILCFVPYHIVRLPYTLAQTKVITDCQTQRKLFLGKESTLLLTVLHLCFDPLLFFYLYEPFRQAFRRMFPCCRSQAASDAEQQAAQEMMQTAASARQEDAVNTRVNPCSTLTGEVAQRLEA